MTQVATEEQEDPGLWVLPVPTFGPREVIMQHHKQNPEGPGQDPLP